MKIVENQTWKNWAHTFEEKPEKVFYPKTIEEVCSLVKDAKEHRKKIRVIGAGHSFTELARTNEWLVSLDLLSGIEDIDEDELTATVYAGTRLHEIGEELGKRGYAQENLGDINVQSIAGAISTGTHGTGIQFGNVSSQVIALTFVTADGEVITTSKTENQSYFHASLVSLGTFGIIVKVKLKMIKAPIYEYRSDKVKFQQLIKDLPDYINNNRHFEFYMFPYSDLVQVKTMNITEKQPQSLSFHHFKNLWLENYLFYFLSTISKWIPKTSSTISKISALGVGKASVVSESFNLFATPRLVRFREMEYCIPIEHFQKAIREVKEKIETERFQVHFPIECRVVKGDDIWLSPSYQRNSAYIAFHMYKGMDYEHYFASMEEIMLRYEGRPHWGKMHTRTKEDLSNIYPKFQEFCEIRKQLDPNNMFLNDYLQELLY